MSNLIQYIQQNPLKVVFFLSVAKIVLVSWLVLVEWQVIALKKRLKIFFKGSQAGDLEGVIAAGAEKIKALENAVADLYGKNEIVDKIARAGLQKVGLLRFNAFNDVGGDQSFALALLDYQNNGAVILSLFGREGIRVYAKAIKNGKSEYNLAEEEEKAIEQAMGM